MFSTAIWRTFGDLLRRLAWPVSAATRAAAPQTWRARFPHPTGKLPSGPKTCGNSAGSILPSITLQSVTVNGPPGGSTQVPDWRPPNAGPTRKRAPSKVQIEPPPAASGMDLHHRRA
jgi:hypothetical protein